MINLSVGNGKKLVGIYMFLGKKNFYIIGG